MGFQLCYDKDWTEHAFTWMAGRGFNHMRVDTEGGDLASGRGTPLLVANGSFDATRILEVFQAECQRGRTVPSWLSVRSDTFAYVNRGWL